MHHNVCSSLGSEKVSVSFTTVGVLAIIVVIRTFLSFTLEVELTGHWPWQKQNGS
jgi:uncharacterized membrane protein